MARAFVSSRAARAARLAALLVVAAAGCREEIVAPVSCPALCPARQVQLVDTVLQGVVVSDTSFRGYVAPQEAFFLVASDLDSLQSVGLVLFVRRQNRWFPTLGDTVGVPIGSLDSVQMEIQLDDRDTSVRNIRLLLYRLPAQFDTTATFASAQSFFDDSLLVDSISIPDSLALGTVRVRLRALETPRAESLLAADSGVIALGLAVRAAAKTALSVVSGDVPLAGPAILYYARGPAPQDTLTHLFQTRPAFDTFVYAPPAAAAGADLAVGGLPSARSVVRFDLPRVVVDSDAVVRGTLLLTPTTAARGRPGERFAIEARTVLHDVGAKSIIHPDTAMGGIAVITVGSTSSVEIDIGRVLRFWGSTAGDSVPRVLLLRAAAEESRLGEVRFARRSAGAAAPKLRVTYVARRVLLGVP